MIRLAIVGIGNCASSFIQAITLNRNYAGLENPKIGGYTLEDIKVVLAYDVSINKVDFDISEAIKAPPNCTTIYNNIPSQGLPVMPGILKDGLDGPLGKVVEPDPRCFNRKPSDIAEELCSVSADVMVCYLPTGSSKDVRNYALAALQSSVAFINAGPERIVHDEHIRNKFKQAHIPLLGDDMKSHAGATALHTLLIDFLKSRNITVENTYQLNIGGNADFKNLADQNRSLSKNLSKQAALKGAGVGHEQEVLAGPTGFVPFLHDHKTAFIYLEGCSVLGMKLNIDVKLEVEDSPNVVSVIADAVRIAMLSRFNPSMVESACGHLFKNPLNHLTHSQAQSNYNLLVKSLNNNQPDMVDDSLVVRESVRGVLMDKTKERILLSRVCPQKDDKRRLWVTLGGRIRSGENHKKALERELVEELKLKSYEIQSRIWFGNEIVEWKGVKVRLIEHFYLVFIPHEDYRFFGKDDVEFNNTYEIKWWDINDVESSTDQFVPCNLSALISTISDANNHDRCIPVRLENGKQKAVTQ